MLKKKPSKLPIHLKPTVPAVAGKVIKVPPVKPPGQWQLKDKTKGVK